MAKSNLTFDQFASWSKHCAVTINCIGKDSFGEALLSALRSLVACDSALVLAYAREGRPTVLFEAFDHPLRENNLDIYLQGSYLLDPFYSQAFDAQTPEVLRLNEISPDGFQQSEYFQSYYKRSHVADEVNFVAPADNGVSLVLSYERAAQNPPFSDYEFRLMETVCPEVSALLLRHWNRYAQDDAGQQKDSEHNRLKQKLGALGADILTAREQEVVQLVLQGYLNAAIAQQLNLSVETVKVHRRNIYSKLGISSLSELFSIAMRQII